MPAPRIVPPPLPPEDVLAGYPDSARLALVEMHRFCVEAAAALEKLLSPPPRDSSKSGKPPSGDPPEANRPRRRRRSGRKPGGQPGHPPHARALVPVEKVDRVVQCRPASCAKCGAAIASSDPSPDRHQVVDIEVKRTVVEYRLHTCACGCGAKTRGRLPAGTPSGAFGPCIAAVAGTLVAEGRLSRRQVVRQLRDLFGVHMSLGALEALLADVSEVAAPAHEEVRAKLGREPSVNSDQTGWFEGRRTDPEQTFDPLRGMLVATRKAAKVLSVKTGADATLLVIEDDHSQETARALLGADPSQTKTTDRSATYNFIDDEVHQYCWSHLGRDFERHAEWLGESRKIGGILFFVKEDLFALWHRFKAREITRGELVEQARPLREKVHTVLEYGSQPALAKTAIGRFCRNLLKHEKCLWHFLEREDVDPTNNAAERELRHAVLYRRSSQGTMTPKGSRFAERLLTLRATLAKQRRSVFEWLHNALVARLQGTTAPTIFA